MARCRAATMAVVALLALCATIGGPFGAQAQSVDRELFQAYLNSKFRAALIARLTSRLPEEVFRSCPSLVSANAKVTVVKSVAFAPDGIPNRGAWWERLPVAGCGNDTVLNFYFFAGADGKINTTTGLPGTTHADFGLQRDALKFAYLGAGTLAKDCRRFVVKNTRFSAYGGRDRRTPDPGAGDPYRPWWEIWTVAACGRTFDVPIEFLPDRTGTQIVQTTNDVIER